MIDNDDLWYAFLAVLKACGGHVEVPQTTLLNVDIGDDLVVRRDPSKMTTHFYYKPAFGEILEEAK
jgi:hypothetical protein